SNEPGGSRRNGQVPWRQCMQGPQRLPYRRQCLQGSGQLQGQGFRGHSGEHLRRCGRYRKVLMSDRAFHAHVRAPEAQASGARPWFGYGLGLRTEHFDAVLEEQPAVDWFEIISENFMVAGGKPRHYLAAVRARYPLAMHGVSLSIGSTDALDTDYLRELRDLARDIEPMWVSDHLCWTGHGGINSHDL